ncbi:uncharacterized protein LOC133795682 [Humulus lupulus]|uniref:uncharacterized protein LOC133795682 n=1 Tax=Humulus lupulus TaxID=3486 RepID=UPI002B401D67|nr:uncharacterized protein LOC133795682 [Humulus lupulus]XP_062089130.1 uncharacterized protein LOC133795682 [Humulus lupulus]
MYLRPPSASEEALTNDWIKVRQSGIRYYLSLGDQRIVDKNFIIRPKVEFETVGNEASKMGVSGPWLTKSYLKMSMDRKGVPRLNTPPLLPNTSLATGQQSRQDDNFTKANPGYSESC